MARVKDVNMRAHQVYDERLKKKKEASRGKAKKDEEKARTNEVMGGHDLREDDNNEGAEDEGNENGQCSETPAAKQGKSRGGCQG